MRLIDADALMESLKESADRAKKWYEDCKTYNSAMIDRAEQAVLTFNECGLRIKEAPTVDAVPVRRGKWKAVTEDGYVYKRICSCCGKEAPFDETERVYLIYPHCPWCGADMRGEQHEIT